MAGTPCRFTLRFDLCGIPEASPDTTPVKGVPADGVNYHYEHVTKAWGPLSTDDRDYERRSYADYNFGLTESAGVSGFSCPTYDYHQDLVSGNWGFVESINGVTVSSKVGSLTPGGSVSGEKPAFHGINHTDISVAPGVNQPEHGNETPPNGTTLGSFHQFFKGPHPYQYVFRAQGPTFSTINNGATVSFPYGAKFSLFGSTVGAFIDQEDRRFIDEDNQVFGVTGIVNHTFPDTDYVVAREERNVQWEVSSLGATLSYMSEFFVRETGCGIGPTMSAGCSAAGCTIGNIGVSGGPTFSTFWPMIKRLEHRYTESWIIAEPDQGTGGGFQL